jgi:glycosyltransferase involved in cell wall biosynthesis
MLFERWKFEPIDASEHYFITMISNPRLYEARYTLYERFAKQFPKGKLLTIEIAYGTRDWEVTSQDEEMNVRLRTKEELWHKENALNIGVQYLSLRRPNWKYVTFIDADVLFTSPDFEQKIVHTLQHYLVVQPWQSVVDLGPNDEPIQTQRSFMNNWLNNTWEKPANNDNYYTYGVFVGHPGFAISMRREAFDMLGGLFDTAILGSGDHHFWMAMIGMVSKTRPEAVNIHYKNQLADYEERAVRRIDKNLGYVPIGLQHLWHGPKRNRFYVSRWKILIDNNFDPFLDIRRDSQGLYTLDGDDKLKRDIQLYFTARLEDTKEF